MGRGTGLIPDAGVFDRLGGAPRVHVSSLDTAAGYVLGRESVRLESALGVIDLCLFEAIFGEDSVVLCSTATPGQRPGRASGFATIPRFPNLAQDMLGGAW